jgi:CheY-like chemotaxis protein
VRGTEGAERLLSGKRVLVVDDDEDARLVLAIMLRQSGAEVATASSVAQAFEIFAAERFDVVVSDIAMPGEDGYALIERLRKSSAVPAIAVSAIATGAEDRERALAAGFTEFVRKPVDPTELASIVASALAEERRRPAG